MPFILAKGSYCHPMCYCLTTLPYFHLAFVLNTSLNHPKTFNFVFMLIAFWNSSSNLFLQIQSIRRTPLTIVLLGFKIILVRSLAFVALHFLEQV